MQRVDVQRQIGSPAADCGLFSIAFAICICNKLDPHTVGFVGANSILGLTCHHFVVFLKSFVGDGRNGERIEKNEVNL